MNLILILFHSFNLPPPSRSRENTINIFDPNFKPHQHIQSSSNNPHVTSLNNYNDKFGYQLVPVYIPNEGYRYFLVIPTNKWNYLNSNFINNDLESQQTQKYDKHDKYNGKYNSKLKKYKAYEKFTKPHQPYFQEVRIKKI